MGALAAHVGAGQHGQRVLRGGGEVVGHRPGGGGPAAAVIRGGVQHRVSGGVALAICTSERGISFTDTYLARITAVDGPKVGLT